MTYFMTVVEALPAYQKAEVFNHRLCALDNNFFSTVNSQKLGHESDTSISRSS